MLVLAAKDSENRIIAVATCLVWNENFESYVFLIGSAEGTIKWRST